MIDSRCLFDLVAAEGGATGDAPDATGGGHIINEEHENSSDEN